MKKVCVCKRDGSEHPFELAKIVSALDKAFLESGETTSTPRELIEHVDSQIQKKPGDQLKIPDIQDIVERALMEKGFYDTAKRYILYRHKRDMVRSAQSAMTKIADANSLSLPIPWGPVGYVTYKRTYSRPLHLENTDKTSEEFQDTIVRVLTACQTQLNINFTNSELKYAYDAMMGLKFSVAGRFLWQLGTTTVDRLGLASLQNCAFVKIDAPIRPFLWIFDMLMLGVGVGFSVERCNVDKLPKVLDADIKITRKDTKDADFIVPDSREGWVSLMERVLAAYFVTGASFSYSTILVRSAGSPIKGFGGVASGPADLCKGLLDMQSVLSQRRGLKLKPIDCLDLVNIIASVVVAGNIRRSACICIGDMDDIEYLRAKRWDLGNIPNWRAMSNNSIVCDDTSKLPDEFWEGYMGNGEPYGLINLRLARSIGRTQDGDKYPDPEVAGFNPCVTGDTLVLTTDGLKTVEELVGKEFQAVINGHAYASTPGGFWKTGDKEVVCLTLANGSQLKATPEHKVLTAQEGWREIGSLTNSEGIEIVMNDSQKVIRIEDMFSITSRVASVTPVEGMHAVYDCTIPGINCFSANGIIAHNCAEQGLANHETCCLSELYLPNIKTFDEAFSVAIIAYRICKHSLMLPCHHPETQAIVRKNMRMGIGSRATCRLRRSSARSCRRCTNACANMI
jgi:ribonucleotide reductase alpha subunit